MDDRQTERITRLRIGQAPPCAFADEALSSARIRHGRAGKVWARIGSCDNFKRDQSRFSRIPQNATRPFADEWLGSALSTADFLPQVPFCAHFGNATRTRGVTPPPRIPSALPAVQPDQLRPVKSTTRVAMRSVSAGEWDTNTRPMPRRFVSSTKKRQI